MFVYTREQTQWISDFLKGTRVVNRLTHSLHSCVELTCPVLF